MPDTPTMTRATGGATGRKSNPALVAEQALKCFELKARGWSVRRIGAETGLTPATVQRRITHQCAEIVTPAVEHYRRVADETLDVAQAEAFAILESADDPDVRLRAIDRIVRVVDRRAKLHGLDAPAKTEAIVAVQTTTEVELEALFAAQDAANAAARAELDGD